MKLQVEGVEEIEITDPLGLSNPPVPQQGIPIQQQPTPLRPHVNPGFLPQGWPTPQLPTPIIPMPIPANPGDWGIPVPHKPPIYTRHVHDPNDPLQRGKWGVGGPMIQQAAQDVDPDKFEKNWQAKMNGAEGQEDGNQHTH